MSANHDHTIYLTLAGNEIAIDIGYDVLPGRPETGPSYDCGGEPAEPAEVVLRTVEAVLEEWRFGKNLVKREPVTGWLLSLIANDPDINADLISEAGAYEDDARAAARADDLYDMRRSA